jgi:hypothetical protein
MQHEKLLDWCVAAAAASGKLEQIKMHKELSSSARPPTGCRAIISQSADDA